MLHIWLRCHVFLSRQSCNLICLDPVGLIGICSQKWHVYIFSLHLNNLILITISTTYSVACVLSIALTILLWNRSDSRTGSRSWGAITRAVKSPKSTVSTTNACASTAMPTSGNTSLICLTISPSRLLLMVRWVDKTLVNVIDWLSLSIEMSHCNCYTVIDCCCCC